MESAGRCRTCLLAAPSPELFSLTTPCNDSTFLQILQTFTGSVTHDNRLSQLICQNCQSLLQQYDNFRQRCLRSEQILLEEVESLNSSQHNYEVPLHSKNDLDDYLPPDIHNFLVKCGNNDIKEESSVDNNEVYDDHNLSDSDEPLVKSERLDSNYEGCKLVFESSSHSNLQNKIDHLNKITCKRKLASYDKALTENNLTEYECSHCEIKLKSERAIKSHFKKKHSKKVEYASNNVENKTDINSVPIEKIQCSLCIRKFTKKESYELHMRKHEERARSKFSCDFCQRDFKHRAHLLNHIQSLHNKETKQEIIEEEKLKKHSCQFCGKSFTMSSTLKDHIRTHTGEKPFLCSTCGRGFSQKANLKEHMRRHQGLKPYKCDICNQSFVAKGELVAHNRKHTGAHPFICNICKAGFTTSSSLVKHRRMHSGERPYSCEFCPMRFAATSTLKNHKRTHTGEKPYHCAHCEKAFVQRNDLVSHTRCHTGERPYVCPTCGQAFRQGSALKTHMKIHSVRSAPALIPLLNRRDISVIDLHNINIGTHV